MRKINVAFFVCGSKQYFFFFFFSRMLSSVFIIYIQELVALYVFQLLTFAVWPNHFKRIDRMNGINPDVKYSIYGRLKSTAEEMFKELLLRIMKYCYRRPYAVAIHLTSAEFYSQVVS